jgi:hypothetical protein
MKTFPNPNNPELDVGNKVLREDIPAIEDEPGFADQLVQFVIVYLAEL